MQKLLKKTSYCLLLFSLIILPHHISQAEILEPPPVINPAISWHTYLGSSSSFDECHAVAVDKQGNVCLMGISGYTWGKPINPYAGGGDVFVAKLNKNGKLLWNTFLGSAAPDKGRGIAVDGKGNIYIVGSSVLTWGVPVHAHMRDTQDAFAAKLNSKGELKWHTFMGGGNSGDVGLAIAVDANGNAHVGGFGGAFWDTQPVYLISSGTDGWVAKLNSAGARQWYTPMGSSDMASVRALALDKTGDLYVAGWTEGPWFTSPVNPYSDKRDAFAAKLDSRGVKQWHTFMGSKDYDTGMGIALDGNGNILVSGSSAKTWGEPINYGGKFGNAFVAKLNSRGALIWNTFWGSDYSPDLGWAVAADAFGNVYASGGYPVLKLNHEGTFQWGVTMMQLIGEGNSIALDPTGNVYVACRGGEVEWDDPPVNPYAGNEDGMAVKIDRGIRLLSWNLLNYSGRADGSRNTEIRKVLDIAVPDILVVQEVENAKAANHFLKNVLNKNSSRKYKAAKFHDGPDTDNALFYNKEKLSLLAQKQIPTSFRDISEYSLKIKSGLSEGSEFNVYSAHFSEGNRSTHKQQRKDQAEALRSYLNGMPENKDFLVCGTLNMTSSGEPAYKALTGNQSGDVGANNGRLMDLFKAKGNWSGKAKFKFTHTESTRISAIAGAAGGGLKNRYDMILVSYALSQDKKLTYMPGSSFVLGNDGKHLKKAINDPENRIFSSEIADAFYKASDHLPVIIDLISLEKPLK